MNAILFPMKVDGCHREFHKTTLSSRNSHRPRSIVTADDRMQERIAAYPFPSNLEQTRDCFHEAGSSSIRIFVDPLTPPGRPVLYRHGHYYYYCYYYSKSYAAPDLPERPRNGLSSAFLIRLPYTRDYYSNHATSAELRPSETSPSCAFLASSINFSFRNSDQASA